MYVSRKMARSLAQRLWDENGCKVFTVRLCVGNIAVSELRGMVDAMFRAWRVIASSHSVYTLRTYAGGLRKLFIRCDVASGSYEAYFYLVLARPLPASAKSRAALHAALVTEKTREYIRWLSRWVTALGFFESVSVDVAECATEAEIRAAVEQLCASADAGDEKQAPVIREATGKHRLVSLFGICAEVWRNRHVSVGR